ncbi:hypothetical protein [Anaerostipes sp.]|uniref:hypothetical protein n=1 Tax=Anaerostipes sp. TaxID=1872530 RepID=UPI0025C49FC6|nr:hypothetical protein [Anaerostipes sp.]MBS7007463.1 hypothetical protein [Anaerostipes sp.]
MIRKNKEQNNNLLEYLAEEAGCQELSDLPTSFWFPVACFIAGSVQPDQYSLKEWNEAVRYLTGVKIRFFSQRKAQKFLEENKDNFYTETEAKKL